jgi:antitoxin HigA-1
LFSPWPIPNISIQALPSGKTAWSGSIRQALTNLLSGKAGISPEMALRLDKAFGGGAETWLQRQLLHDLAKARLRLDELNVLPVVSAQQPALF